MEKWEEEIEHERKLKERAEDDLKKMQAALLLAGFKVKAYHELVNGYHGWSREIWHPWYLFETDVGLIKIGWRKRVIHCDWASTEIAWERPIDQDVTYGPMYFHAYGYEKLMQYLTLLHPALMEKK